MKKAFLNNNDQTKEFNVGSSAVKQILEVVI